MKFYSLAFILLVSCKKELKRYSVESFYKVVSIKSIDGRQDLNNDGMSNIELIDEFRYYYFDKKDKKMVVDFENAENYFRMVSNYPKPSIDRIYLNFPHKIINSNDYSFKEYQKIFNDIGVSFNEFSNTAIGSWPSKENPDFGRVDFINIEETGGITIQVAVWLYYRGGNRQITRLQINYEKVEIIK